MSRTRSGQKARDALRAQGDRVELLISRTRARSIGGVNSGRGYMSTGALEESDDVDFGERMPAGWAES